jgi:hypothetical protein
MRNEMKHCDEEEGEIHKTERPKEASTDSWYFTHT